ncbi:hypothetical protein D3C81_1800740 [compost metagenome]
MAYVCVIELLLLAGTAIPAALVSVWSLVDKMAEVAVATSLSEALTVETGETGEALLAKVVLKLN